ncbi:MAG: IPT/TIG domain-containing protein [Nitrosomonadales bacterium]|nr:IPT/TIG domain-containing protein [Nitrosomonadales bacterium]
MQISNALRKAVTRGIGLNVVILLTLAGCGGGGSGSSTATSSTLGAVAAVGYPIVGGVVQVKCASGPVLGTTTGSTGTWQVILSAGQSLPCAVEIKGGTINNVANNTSYHSIATVTGTVNVTPLTDLLVANLAAQDPGTWFAGLSTSPAKLAAITQAKVDSALANLRSALSGLVPLSTINPITTSFFAIPGNAIDDMLAALQAAITNSGGSYTYSTLLNAASTISFTTAVAALNTALPVAYAGTTSGSVPSVTGMNPVSGAAGTLVTITGTHFSTTAASNIVSFNGVQASVTSATISQLVVTVPATATSGNVTVTVGGNTATLATGFIVTPAASGGSGGSGMAAQYFTKKAVGNTWTWSTSGGSDTATIITPLTGMEKLALFPSAQPDAIYFNNTCIRNGSSCSPYKSIHQIDSSGALISKADALSWLYFQQTIFPATFSVGTSWVYQAGGGGLGQAVNATIVAFNVTRTVPAGTFNDCIQINMSESSGSNTLNYALYYSPTVGNYVETTVSSSTSGVVKWSYSGQLQAGYIANP